MCVRVQACSCAHTCPHTRLCRHVHTAHTPTHVQAHTGTTYSIQCVSHTYTHAPHTHTHDYISQTLGVVLEGSGEPRADIRAEQVCGEGVLLLGPVTGFPGPETRRGRLGAWEARRPSPSTSPWAPAGERIVAPAGLGTSLSLPSCWGRQSLGTLGCRGPVPLGWGGDGLQEHGRTGWIWCHADAGEGAQGPLWPFQRDIRSELWGPVRRFPRTSTEGVKALSPGESAGTLA